MIDLKNRICYNLKMSEVRIIMKYFTCKKCRYTFCTDVECERCPDCGKKDIRSATDGEIQEYFKFREEFKDDKANY